MHNLIYMSSFSWAWIGDSIKDGIAALLYTVLLWLNCIIYSFISFVYQIFLVLANGGEIFENGILRDMVSRLYVVIGVIVLFLVAYSLLKNMIDPDKALKDKKGPANVIKDVLISIVLIAVVPYAFEFAFDFQNSLLVNNTIGKLIVGSPSNEEVTSIRDGGYIMAATVWQAFLHPTEDESGTPYCNVDQEPEAEENGCEVLKIGETTYGGYWENAKENSTFFSLVGLAPAILDGSIDYLFIVDIVAGIFVLFVMLDYCLQMAIRLVKLAVFQLIAPLPILARIMPNEQASKVFSNWLKATISTFVEVFIRVAILYFAILIITTVSTSIDNLFLNGAWGSDSTTLPFVKSIAQALIVIGIIMFVKQAPGIIKDITGLDGGKYNVLNSAMRTAAGLGGAITTATKNWNTKKEVDGSERPMRRRILGAVAGAGSAAWRSNWNADNIKDIKTMRENAKTSTEAAIKKRIARDNAKYEQKMYIDRENERRQQNNEPLITTNFGKKVAFQKYQAKLKATEWAGASAFSDIQYERLAAHVKDNKGYWSSSEDIWKTKRGYKDAESKLKDLEPKRQRLEAAWNSHVADFIANNAPDYNNMSDRDKRAVMQLAQESFARYDEMINVQEEITDAEQTKVNIEREEKNKKANAIAINARKWITSLSSRPDVAINIEEMLNERITDATKKQEMLDAWKAYKDLSNDSEVFKKLQADLEKGKFDENDPLYKQASMFLNIQDEYHKAGESELGELEHQKQLREDTFGSNKEGNK